MNHGTTVSMLSVLALGAAALIGMESPATIIDSGSTNVPGFRIVVSDSGNAERTSRGGDTPVRRTLSPAAVKRFHDHLKAAQPFSSLAAVHCIKSASFGSTLMIEFGGEQTPDLSCGDGGNTAMRNLIRDVNEIVGLFRGN